MTSRDRIGPWRRSSYSGGNGNCVEVAPLWRKSSYSAGNGDCVEVAQLHARDGQAVRDSKDPSGPMLTFASKEWSSFISTAKTGTFDT